MNCPVLIETLWNVNLNSFQIRLLYVLVLIETLWNVNEKRERKVENAGYVLIETLWNVNEHSDRKEWHKRVCINRNIVECKSGTGAVSAMPYAY